MKSLEDISYHLACQKAYSGQLKCPYVVFERGNGLWGAVALGMWKIVKVGVPHLLVYHTPRGMCVAGWEFTDGGSKTNEQV